MAKGISNPEQPKQSNGGCTVKAKSCKEGLRSAPFIGGIGNILSNGFEVNIVNKRKENITKQQTPKTQLEKLVLIYPLLTFLLSLKIEEYNLYLLTMLYDYLIQEQIDTYYNGKRCFNSEDVIIPSEIPNLISDHNYIEYKDTIPNLLKSQILLLIEADNDESSFVIPAKIFEYINSSRPIIAIGPKDSEIRQIINKTKSGKYFLHDEYEKLLKYIEESYQLKKLKIKPINTDQYHRKNLAKKLSDLILKETD